MGELAMMVGTSLETIRFVHGGLGFLDSRMYKTRASTFEIRGDEFNVAEVGAMGQYWRVASDWGWEFVCLQGMVRFVTFDRERGFAAHNGALSRDQHGVKWMPHPVMGTYIHSNPAFGLYSTATIPPPSSTRWK